MGDAGLEPTPPRHLQGDPLTVAIWTAYRQVVIETETRAAAPAPEQVMQP